MKQYIDKDAVVAEIKKRAIEAGLHDGVIAETREDECYSILSFLDTLEVKDEVVSTDPTSPSSLKISRHGDSHIEAMKEALRMEYEKGRADVLRGIDPDAMVADFCSQPLSKTRSLASIYRQGIIDIVKRINNNEKTSITGTRSIDDGGVQLPKP